MAAGDDASWRFVSLPRILRNRNSVIGTANQQRLTMLKIINSTMANRYRHMGAIAALACSFLILSTRRSQIG